MNRWQYNQGGGNWQTNAPVPREKSVVVKLIIANVVVFVLQMLSGDQEPGKVGWVSYYFGLSRDGLASGYLWQMVTYMFLHAGVLHILANMLIIYFAGRFVERILGPRKFLTVYFIGGILGGLAQIAFSPAYLVGASAAGFAILIVFTAIVPEMQITMLLFFIIPVRLKAKYLALGAFAVSLMFTVFPPGDNVGHLAHLVGCISGWVYAKFLGYGSMLPGREVWDKFRGPPGGPKPPPVRDARFTMVDKDIDAILDKISKHGMQSLTPEERQMLEKEREKIVKRSSVR